VTSTASPLARTSENVDRRVLGAVNFVDAVTAATVTSPLVVQSSLDVRQNRSGLWVVFGAPGLGPATSDFLPSGAWPAPMPFPIAVRDPAGFYLPRRAMVNVPRALVPVTSAGSVFAPQAIALYPSAIAPMGPNWAVVHVSAVVAGTTPPVGVGAAIIRVVRTSDAAVLGIGMLDDRGQGLAAVPGLGVRASSSGGSTVLSTTTDVTVELHFDAAAAGLPVASVDPDSILANLGPTTVASQPATLGAGSSIALSFSISL
jgi:hypothetical protein